MRYQVVPVGLAQGAIEYTAWRRDRLILELTYPRLEAALAMHLTSWNWDWKYTAALTVVGN